MNDVRAMPTDAASVASRGEWLGIAYLQASRRDLELLTKQFGLTLPKTAQNRIRLEMTVFSLSKSAEILDGVLRDKFADFPTDTISTLKNGLLVKGALAMLTTMFPDNMNRIVESYTEYEKREEGSQLFWKRMAELGLHIEMGERMSDLLAFEQTVLHGTTLLLALDALTVPQDKIERAHEGFFSSLDKK